MKTEKSQRGRQNKNAHSYRSRSNSKLPTLPKTAVSQAQQTGLEKKEILEAIAIGRVVRKGAMGKMDKFASTLTGNDNTASSNECPFGSTEEDMKQWVEQDDHCDCSS